MTATTAQDAPAAVTTRWRNVIPWASMILVVTIGSLIPLFRNANFYFWDDTAAVAVGVWQRIPEAILAGESPFLQLDMWRGGNLIAEAATGMWNPVMLGLMFVTHPIDNLAIAITICKIALFLIAAAGVYALARNYGANRWMSALAGAVMPLSGWALFIDGSAWINGSAIAAFTPWAWWALRRAFLKGWTAGAVAIAIVCGYLLTSVGNPYGLLTILVAYIALAVEIILVRRWSALWWLVGIGATTVALSVVVYLPFLLTSSVGFRAGSGILNDEFLAVSLSNLLGMSTPSYQPYIRMFGLPVIQTPAMYLAWFLLPILPWLKWRMPRERLLALAGVFSFGVVFLMLVLGPSQFLMFRWPARLIPFLYLALIIAFAVIASRGFARNRFGMRVTLSIVAVMLGAWLAASDVPHLYRWHILSIAGAFVLGAIFLRWGRSAQPRAFGILAGGMLAFLILQVGMSPSNSNVADYNLPTSRAEFQQGIGERYEGVTLQIADPMGGEFDRTPDGGWQDMLIGTMFSVAGVDALNSYSGIGFTTLDNALCMTYNGSTCRDAWEALWTPPKGSATPLADLLGLQTIILQAGFIDDPAVPDGWRLDAQTEQAMIYVRDNPVLNGGRVTWTDGVTVASDVVFDVTSEDVTFESDGTGGSLILARIAWPGYHATIDGDSVTVEAGPAGLVQIDVPAGVDSGVIELRFTPPGLNAGLVSAAVGLLCAIVLVIIARRRSADLSGTKR